MQELTDEATDIPTMEPTPNPRRYYVAQENQKAKCREKGGPYLYDDGCGYGRASCSALLF